MKDKDYNQKPIKVYSKLEKSCIDLFGEEDGLIVANFYDYYFDTSFKKDGFTKSMSVKEKIEGIKFLVEKHGKEKFVACVKKFDYDYNHDIYKSHNYNYFSAAVANFKIKTPTNINILKKEVKPIVYKKMYDNYKTNFLNYHYQCECGTIFDGWTMECPSCHAIFNISDIDERIAVYEKAQSHN